MNRPDQARQWYLFMFSGKILRNYSVYEPAKMEVIAYKYIYRPYFLRFEGCWGRARTWGLKRPSTQGLRDVILPYVLSSFSNYGDVYHVTTEHTLKSKRCLNTILSLVKIFVNMFKIIRNPIILIILSMKRQRNCCYDHSHYYYPYHYYYKYYYSYRP